MRYRSHIFSLRSAPLSFLAAFSAAFALAGPSHVMAQVNINIPGVNVNVNGKSDSNVSISVGGKNDAGNTAGQIEGEIEMEGVAIINGEVTIDGEKVPKGRTRHTGRKSGVKYLIKWGKSGNVAVSQE